MKDDKAGVNRREEHWRKLLAEQIIRPFVDRLIADGVVPPLAPYEITWPTTHQADTDEITADVSLTAPASSQER